ncbi:adaptin ear-binding coat-associated protein 1 isoform X2 [Antennarius striatus]|uniref:adaptin ear-binding coat-associated protein 1 isoform X2 n=1 Tax=Antennarius striatus TaxID=241820 RepID=UPI0035AF7700
MAAEGEYESILCVKPDVNVYRIPPRASNRSYRAADWKLDAPDWMGRMRITARGKVVFIKLEDKVSGRSAFIGVGFGDRGDAFDFNVALQDHFKWVKQEREISRSAQLGESGPKLDLGFKEGQTITLNIGQGRKRDKPRPQQGSSGFGLLPPPPGGKIAPPPSSNHNTVPQTGGPATGCLLDLDSSNSNTVLQPNPGPDLWGDFSAPTSSVPPSRPQDTANWIQF